MEGHQKVSRYRSVRRAQEQSLQQDPSPQIAPPLPPMPALPEDPAPKEAPVSRSMSRYHRRPTVSHTHATAPNVPPLRANTTPTAAPPAPATAPVAQALPPAARNRAVSSPQHTPHAANSGQPRPRTAKQRSEASPPVSTSARQQSARGDDSARLLMQKERERQRVLKEKYDAEARAIKEARQAALAQLESQRKEEEEAVQLKAQQEADAAEALRRQKEEQKAEQERGKRLRKAEAQRLQQEKEEEARRFKQEEKERRAKLEELARNAPSSSHSASPPRNDQAFGLFKRRRDDGLTAEAPVKHSSPPRLSLHLGDREADTIRPGGGGAVLGIDAPTSAVNAGDRRVTVVCGSKRIQLPVTPTTTPLDLIKSAATVLTDPIDVRTAAVSELFAKVSITRPLRNYEYVRDVMNSWDFDTQNSLTIIDSQLDGVDQDDLLSYKVPETRPEGVSNIVVQYSSRPGKWSKRYLTLRPDGQLVMAKSEKVKEKDQENICTLTDYDIYSITQEKLAKVRPPKKICYAVKSMQKSNIFADESQYVHFFCTNERSIATTLYKALQSWRSWYLKHQKGEGLKKKTVASRNVSGNSDSAHMTSSHTRGESVGSHYQLGAFTSLLDMNDFNKQLDSIEVHRPGEFPDDKPLGRLDTRAMHARKKSLRVKHPPPTSFNRSAMASDSNTQPTTRNNSLRRSFEEDEEETFAAGGLLGRTYTQRQVAAQAREQNQAGAFTDGPSLLNNMGRMGQMSNDSGLKRNSSVRSTHHRTSSDLQRSASKRMPGMREPLVDLSPVYRPPPQHANKGKGYNPGAGSGPLVESATSIEEAIKIPPSTDWRARPTTSRANGLERVRSLKGRGEPLAAHTYNNHSGAPDDDRNAFTGGGLLSTAGYSQGPAVKGRGVMDGSKAKGPMLNLGDDNKFSSGSLLSALPNSGGPAIDRSGR